MLSAEQIRSAHDQIRELAIELAGEIEDPDAFEHAMRACDNVRMAAQVQVWSTEHWLSQGLEQALKATAIDPAWVKLAGRIKTLVACHTGIAVA